MGEFTNAKEIDRNDLRSIVCSDLTGAQESTPSPVRLSFVFLTTHPEVVAVTSIHTASHNASMVATLTEQPLGLA